MIIFGFITALASGLALPGHMIMFGRVINNFVFYNTIIENNLTAPITERAKFLGVTCSEFVQENPTFIAQRLTSTVENTSALLCSEDAENVFMSTLDYACDPDTQLRDTIGLFSVYYIALATGTLITVFLATSFWNVSAYRQTRRMRQAFYRSILHQEIGWFDVNKTNELSTRLAE